MPPLDEFSPLVKKRNMPIKALLLDQSFSAGVGNWVAGECSLCTPFMMMVSDSEYSKQMRFYSTRAFIPSNVPVL